MKRSLQLIMAVSGAITAAGSCIGDELRRNPFEHPNFDAEIPQAGSRPGIVSDEDLRVSAILIAGERSLVNINGTILGLGEEQNGYVLQAVEEEEAVFSREGRTITISLFEQRIDANDN